METAQALQHVRTHLRAVREQIAAFDFINHGERGGRGERVAPERVAVAARGQARGNLFGGERHAHRHAVRDTLREAEEVRQHAAVLPREPAPGPKARLHLVQDQHRPVLLRERPCRLEITLRRGVDAALALHRLQNHRGGLGRDRRRECVRITERHAGEPLKHGEVRLPVFLFRRCREGTVRAAVVAPAGGDYVGLPRCGPRELQRRLHGLRAGVAKEGAMQFHGYQAGQAVQICRADIVVEALVATDQLSGLLGDRRGNGRVGVAEDVHAVVAREV